MNYAKSVDTFTVQTLLNWNCGKHTADKIIKPIQLIRLFGNDVIQTSDILKRGQHSFWQSFA